MALPTNASTDMVAAVTDAITGAWPVFLGMSGFVIGLTVLRKVRRG